MTFPKHDRGSGTGRRGPGAPSRRLRAAAAILAGLLVAPAAAGTAVAAAQTVDHERARAAAEAGEIMPLHEILLKVDSQFNGRVIEVKLTDLEAGLHGWIYAVTLLTPQDNVLILKVDAGTGVLLQVEGHGVEEARKAP